MFHVQCENINFMCFPSVSNWNYNEWKWMSIREVSCVLCIQFYARRQFDFESNQKYLCFFFVDSSAKVDHYTLHIHTVQTWFGVICAFHLFIKCQIIAFIPIRRLNRNLRFYSINAIYRIETIRCSHISLDIPYSVSSIHQTIIKCSLSWIFVDCAAR